MARLVRFACAVALVGLVGCTGSAVPLAQTTTVVLAPSTIEGTPTAVAVTSAPTLEVAPEATPAPVATPAAVSGSDAVGQAMPSAALDQPAPSAADADAQAAAAPTATSLASCDDTNRPDPLPVPGSARAQDFFRSFRAPLPPAPLYDPPGQKRVGLQAGHWQTDQVPPELGRLQGGAVGGGKEEWQVNLDVAQRTAALLEASGIQVDVLPATVPPHYQANAFVALHADGDTTGQTRGFKVTRPGFSSIPDVDDRLVEAINQTYGAETELPRDDEHISLRMKYYYAFNSRRYCHAVAPGVPQAIIEMAYLTSATDRQYLIGDPERLGRAVADAIQGFLATLP